VSLEDTYLELIIYFQIDAYLYTVDSRASDLNKNQVNTDESLSQQKMLKRQKRQSVTENNHYDDMLDTLVNPNALVGACKKRFKNT
jgi:hypothetical protein